MGKSPTPEHVTSPLSVLLFPSALQTSAAQFGSTPFVHQQMQTQPLDFGADSPSACPLLGEMEKMKVFLLICGVLPEIRLSAAASVFLSKPSADSVLSRQRRHNAGAFEEMMRDNLERECIEENCSLEEAREVFENEEQTREFWVSYKDGDQCVSSPCQNGGTCEDGMSSYVCWCPSGFIGKNCELEMVRQCDVNNGGCMHFCLVDKTYGVVCDCADGYRLSLDTRSCEPMGEFPCGSLGADVSELLSTRTLISAENINHVHSVDLQNSTESNVTQPNSTATPELSSATTRPASDHHWAFFPTLSTITEQSNSDQRIVGGNEATPGEIPWQVALVTKDKNLTFCGGSLLSEVWVVTAAHCLVEGKIGAFFVRLGEHDVKKDEGRESDHEIAQYHTHPNYNFQRSHNHDIALLKLRAPVAFSDYARPICLGPKHFTENLLKSAHHSLVSGWGRLRYGGHESETLQKVELPYVDRTECKGSDKISRFMFCAGYNTIRKDSCQGDSGGPHATSSQGTWFLTGVISWGDECAKEGKYGIYTRVSRYMNWITNTTGIRAGSSGK
ncbi:coagulation factor IXb isoform X2 [Salminus brasiliensis]|uniref:coagulation factor IXb isoform X2 n=1 Tax=Salminus brasiliensis TaxID=930266 RepID=UPI003B82E5FF